MLDATLTLNYDPEGGSSPTDDVFSKKTHDEDRAFYRNTAAILASDPLQDTIQLGITEPKRTASFYGTRRHNVVIREEETIDSPTGEVVGIGLLKFESSIPEGYPPASKRKVLEKFKALLASDAFEAFFFNLEC